MDQLLDYIKWRGDIPFSVSPLNEADSYIICKIGVLDWTDIIGRQEEPVLFRDALNLYLQRSGEIEPGQTNIPSVHLREGLKAAAATERFGELRLSGFISILEERKTEQFSALTVTLPSGVRFFTFRGTDDTMLAWKENFYMSCSDYVSAQLDALAYLRYHITLADGPVIVGGHSKGGNLAIYAACEADDSVKDRIEGVYCFDGPGFHSDFYQTPGYRKMSDRIYKFIPQTSLIGTLLDNPDEVNIVSSKGFGLVGHDGFSWETCATGYVRASGLSTSSRAFDSSIDSVLADMDNDSRRDFIDSLFNILSSSGISTTSDFSERSRREIIALAMDLIHNEDTNQFITSLIREMAGDYVSETQRDIRRHNRIMRRKREERRREEAIRSMKESGKDIPLP